MRSPTTQGYILALTGALLWGVSGAFMQFLFQDKQVSAEWMVTVRMLISGVLLLSVCSLRRPQKIFAIWRDRENLKRLFLFACLGMISVQYTYFAAIRASNAATATVLQYTGPVMIAAWYAFKEKRWPSPFEALSVALAVGGTFLLVTHGRPSDISISPEALFWGLASAVAFAVYSIQPLKLMRHYPAPIILGWAMLIGGILFSFVHAPWDVVGIWDAQTVIASAFAIIGGTLIAFLVYIQATKLIGARTASLMACAEPLSATLIAVFWLKVPFGVYDWLGAGCIIATLLLLTLRTPSKAAATSPA
ncbi:EamA family transporter [Asticcacaulis sp. SL142]|uniref:DMT family transporter n=1 Tax=Asticcacaulis sp. SL142 TaxID=2995155 RepID=UPI00226CF3EE|nr:EamA family transporter [Asticcacaulis sp. SL142]WAC48753.1 EamA family transporter [Asticcacaulis sp. SL142]